MKTDCLAVLDACVLLPMPLADTLLRMAEAPRLYRPKWSDAIMDEVTRNLTDHWKKSPEQAIRRENALRTHFPEAWVRGYESLIPSMTNETKDRHVLAVAVKSRAELIVTYNARDFPEKSLKRWGIERQGPSTFLIGLHRLEPELVVLKLNEQAHAIGITLPALLLPLKKNVPGFVDFFCEQHRIDPPTS